MRSLILFLVFVTALAIALPVPDMSWGDLPIPTKRPFDRVKRDYDPRTDAPVKVPAEEEEAEEGEDRVKRDLEFSPNTEAPQRPPQHPHPVDRVKRDLSFSPNTEAPQPPPKHHPVKRDLLSFSPNTEAPQRPPKQPFDRVKRDYDPRTDAPVRVPVEDDSAEWEDRA